MAFVDEMISHEPLILLLRAQTAIRTAREIEIIVLSWTYAVASCYVTTPRFCLRQQGTYRSFRVQFFRA